MRILVWSVVSLESEPEAHSKDGDKLMTHHATYSDLDKCRPEEPKVKGGSHLFNELHQPNESQPRKTLIKRRNLQHRTTCQEIILILN